MKRAFLYLCLGLLLTVSAAGQPVQRIAVVKGRSFAPFDQAISAVTAAVRQKHTEVSFIRIDLEKEGTKAGFRRLRGSRPALILAVGSQATEAVAAAVKDTPIIFTMLLSPPQVQDNLTGVYLELGLAEQFAALRQVVPRARRIGVFYNPAQSGAAVQAAAGEAARQGLELVRIEVETIAGLPAKLPLLKGVDALWMIPDPVVFTARNSEYILVYTIKEKLPFFGASEAFVKAGALCSLAVDLPSYHDQTAALVLRVLKGERAAEIPTIGPRQSYLALNLKTAQTIGLAVPEPVVRQAKVVFR